eukprot:COSAG06_NODE_6199_length_3054_cov_1.959391_3_plen_307_part_00
MILLGGSLNHKTADRICPFRLCLTVCARMCACVRVHLDSRRRLSTHSGTCLSTLPSSTAHCPATVRLLTRRISILFLMLRLIVLLSVDFYRPKLGIRLCADSFIILIVLLTRVCQFDQGKRCSSAWLRMATSSCLRFSSPTRPALPSRWRQALMLATAPFLTKVRKQETFYCQKTVAFSSFPLSVPSLSWQNDRFLHIESGTKRLFALTSFVDTWQISTALRRHTRTSPPRPFPTLWAASARQTSRRKITTQPARRRRRPPTPLAGPPPRTRCCRYRCCCGGGGGLLLLRHLLAPPAATTAIKCCT